MFDWNLFFLLVLICVPGIVVITPGTIKTIKAVAASQAPTDRPVPSDRVLIIISAVQTLVLVAVAAAVGIFAAPRAGLEAPFFSALAHGGDAWAALQPQLWPTLLLSIGGVLPFMAAYYFFFRPRLDDQTVTAMERLRSRLGIAGRVLYGGIVEEVLMRWGLMSLFAWIGVLLVGEPTAAVIWTAIVVSGIIFGLGHIPSYVAAGCRRTPMFVAATIFLNLWAALIFGWLFWQYGLAAPILAHMLFHLLWYPVDRYAMAQRAAEAQPAL